MKKTTLLALLFACSAQAQVYKCPSPSGRPVYSDMPCTGTRESQVVSKDHDAVPQGQRQQAEMLRSQNARQADIIRQSEAREFAAREKAREAREKEERKANPENLARACVDRYRGHLAYSQGVSIDSSTIDKDIFGPEIYVQVRTIANPNAPGTKIVIRERFICRLNAAKTAIDASGTEEYVERHKKGERL